MTPINAQGRNWRLIVTLVVCALGILFFMVQIFSLGAFWLVSILDPGVEISQSISIGVLVWSAILGGALLLPVLLLSIYDMFSKPIPRWLDTRRPAFGRIVQWVILVWPIVVLLGWLIAGRPELAAFLLGPINVLVAGLPVLWIYHTAQKGLSGGSQIRQWGIFGFSITLLPVLVILMELLALLGLAAMGGIWIALRISADPQIEREIMYLVNQVVIMGDNIDGIINLLGPYLRQPSVIFWALVIVGGIIPIIEEVLKPIVLWALAGRKISPQEGFLGGLLCGAGFALMENVLFFTNVLLAEDWLAMAIARAGTGVLHMLASGLVGWGLAKTWRDGKWVLQVVTTLGAFVLHGLWNVFALLSGLLPLLIMETEPTLGQEVLFVLPVIILLLISIIAMFWINRHLRKQAENMQLQLIAESSP